LRHAAEQWVLRPPASSAAYASMGLLAEATGGVAYLGETPISALTAIQRAMSLTTDSTERFRLAIVQVRLFVKTENFDSAKKTADSILAIAPSQRPESRQSRDLAGLAILVGKPEEAARWLEANNTDPHVSGGSGIVELSPALLKARLRLLAYASQGSSPDSVHALTVRADAAVRNHVTNQSLFDETRAAVLGTSLSLAFPAEKELLRSIATNDRTIHAEQMALTDRAAAAPLLREMIRQTNTHAPALAMEGPYRMAMIALTIGDTTAALALLDRSLGALTTIGDRFFVEVPQVGGLLRAMILRADLAAARRDKITAARWARAVATLWANADPDLQPLVARMKLLARKS
jgi:hypothetical protein